MADGDVGIGEQGALVAGVAGADGGGEFVQALPERGGFLRAQVGLDAGQGAVLAFADASFLGGGVDLQFGVFVGGGADEQGVEFGVELRWGCRSGGGQGVVLDGVGDGVAVVGGGEGDAAGAGVVDVAGGEGVADLG